ncbi:hypothetical protein LTR03_004089 [Friedmanniomyces endolithicus]|nr:hypothetical protein LTR03_004089 [Friedmanniomyces endolithicus]
MHIRHVHLPGITSFSHAAKLQDRLVSAFLNHKANPTLHPRPPSTVITAQFHPVYTCGRREIGTVTAEQKAYLTQPTQWGEAEFHEALRGGQTTFHGSGQLVAYPVLDLKHHGLTPRCWVHMLESAVIATCGHSGVGALRTENPGVWVSDHDKLCALGVHLRRNITSYGIGLNVSTELGWFKRIVACGLEGKGTTSLALQGVETVPSVEMAGSMFVEKLAYELQGIDSVERVDSIDLLSHDALLPPTIPYAISPASPYHTIASALTYRHPSTHHQPFDATETATMAQPDSERTRLRWSITELPIIRLLNPSGRRRSSKGKEPMVSVPQEALEDAYLPTADARILAVHGMGAPIAWSHQGFPHGVPLFGEPGPSDWYRRMPSFPPSRGNGRMAFVAGSVDAEHPSPTDVSGAAVAPNSMPVCEKPAEETPETPVDCCEGVLEEDDGWGKLL